MNKDKHDVKRSSIFEQLDGRIKDILLLFFLAITLIFAASQIFREDESEDALNVNLSDSESRVIRLLEEIDGVGEASVIVCEAEDGKKSVVVVCEGAKNLLVVMNVREAVAAALGTEQNAVKVYQKK